MGDGEKKPQKTTTQATVSPAVRVRVSVWAVPNDVVVRGTHTITSKYQGLAGLLDDVSLQATFCNKPDLSDLRWDPNFLPGAKDKEVDQWLADVQKGLTKDKIQVLAGYALMAQKASEEPKAPARKDGESDDDFKTRQQAFQRNLSLFKTKKANFDGFNSWINDAADGSENPKMDMFVATLVAFYQKHCASYDGISFDIEGLTPRQNSDAGIDKLAKAVSSFFGKVADALPSQIVGVATGALIDAKTAFNNDNGTTVKALVQARVMPYEMAVGHKNLIVRPMMYDGQPAQQRRQARGDDAVAARHVRLRAEEVQQRQRHPQRQLSGGLEDAGGGRRRRPRHRLGHDGVGHRRAREAVSHAHGASQHRRQRRHHLLPRRRRQQLQGRRRRDQAGAPRAGLAGTPVQVPRPAATAPKP